MAHAGEGDLCKKDGYTQWTTHVGGDAFNNQGQCVSFVARHGVLVSITAPESPPPPVDGGGSVGGDEPPPEDPPVEELPDN
jgi:hypothetical protein